MGFLGKYSSMNHMGFYKKGNLEMKNSWFMYKLFMEMTLEDTWVYDHF